MKSFLSYNKLWIIVFFLVAIVASLFFDSSSDVNNLDAFADLDKKIFWLVRLPRVVCAALVGALLAYAGVLSQGLFRNDLASPSVLGTVSGASVGGVIAFASGLAQHYILAVPLGAIIGCMSTCLFLIAILRKTNLSTQFLLLVGIAVNAFLGAATSFLLTLLMTEHQWAANTFFWMLGGLNAVSWENVIMAGCALTVSLLFIGKLAAQLDVFSFGEEWAQSVGVHQKKLQVLGVCLISLAVGVAVAIGGGISFVGLIAPHITREMVGPRHKNLFIFSLLNGASLLLVADLLSRHIVYPQELQLGVVTAFVGGLFFIYLLFKKAKGSV